MAIDFPDSPSVGDQFVASGKTYQWDGTVWTIYGPQTNPDIFKVDTTNNRVGINSASPSVTLDVTGDAAVSGDLDVTGEFTSRGYRYVQTLYFTSSGSFTKATYPWLRAIRVKCQGAGAGGANRNVAYTSSPGGGGGAMAESFITDIASLGASETITVGAGSAGVASGVQGDSSSGGNSSFGALVIGVGGSGTSGLATYGGVGGLSSACTGDFAVSGNDGGTGSLEDDGHGGNGGGSHFGGGGYGGRRNTTPGANGRDYGGGGGGGTETAAAGAGANGIVIVELYA